MKRHEHGVSLIELVLVVATVIFLALLINNFPSSIASINKSKHSSIARDIVGKQLDALRRQKYADLNNTLEGGVSFTDSGLYALPSSSAVYEINDCPVSVCSNNENIKEVKVRVKWKENSQDETVELSTLIAEGGITQKNE